MVEDETLSEVIGTLRRYGVCEVVTDQFAAPAVVDRLRRAGLIVEAVPMTAVSKTQAFGELRAKLYAHELELYENRDLIAELKRLRSRYSTGHASVVNPRVGQSHGDMAQALEAVRYLPTRRGRAPRLTWTRAPSSPSRPASPPSRRSRPRTHRRRPGRRRRSARSSRTGHRSAGCAVGELDAKQQDPEHGYDRA